MSKTVLKVKCPNCSEVIRLPDDPRIGDLKEQLEKQSQLIERLVEKLEELKAAPPPKKKRTEKRATKHDGPIFSVVTEEDVEVDDE